MAFRILIISALLSLTATLPDAAENRISGPLVGRIIVEGRGTCNGTLIAPSMVLTAGHCILPPNSDKPIKPENLRFLIKRPSNERRRLYVVDNIGFLPSFAYRDSNNPGQKSLEDDIAILRLDGLATRGSHEKIAPPTGNAVGHISERIAEGGTPAGLESCLISRVGARLLAVFCNRDVGFSGTPVFQINKGQRELIGVVTAKGHRHDRSMLYAAVPAEVISGMVWSNGATTYLIKKASDHTAR